MRSPTSPYLVNPDLFRADWAPVRQTFDSRRLEDPRAALEDALSSAHHQIGGGDTVAIACGSRGIANVGLFVRTLVEWLLELGAEPFVVPAMGSHGGATPEGRAHVLSGIGISEDALGIPVRTEGISKRVGRVNDVDVFLDEHALKADWVIPVARVKPHTDFRGPVESGVCKMLTIGLGHRNSAEAMHSAGSAHLPDRIRAVTPVVLDAVKLPFAVAIVEDALDDSAVIELVTPERLAEREPELLRLAAQWMPSLPWNQIDVLVVHEMGKNVSGNGMDPNITGRFTVPGLTCEFETKRLVVLNLTRESNGNATGVGAADIVTCRLAETVDWNATYTNHVASNGLAGARFPLVAINDEEAIAIAIKTLGDVTIADLRLVWVRNTLNLSELMVSPALLRDLGPRVTQTGPVISMSFRQGRLSEPW